MLDRDTAVALLRSGNLQRSVKHILKSGMRNPYTIRVSDESPCEVRVGGELVLTVKSHNMCIEKNWTEIWDKLVELQNNPKFTELSAKCEASLQRESVGAKGGFKGASKGKPSK